MDKTMFPAWEHAFSQNKTLLEARERQIAQMADLWTVFPCRRTHFNRCM